ncbi:benomyl/methotrexate resistance protein [Dothidotthia symphoricarpi CBS 119687]|uniref:Benomyl/methotrexate resistance protein n=1 Tax=Dothidotthia symphoricarpi CBS 119687 TaxID=1392245 RepID=A0A6A5ZYS8_9PLEO|nr:benomyl/methotrexate resistance protein [Dothidotthia symphoricarpi CBS 119687]KAF2124054.1 benomyl/methotrexate resistance protein [Dothidotthia symphoricarpi CBS 119687]
MESGSSSYEKNGEHAMDIGGEKAIRLDGNEAHASKEEEIEPSGRSTSGNRLSQERGSLKRVQSHHSRAGGDGYTCFDAEANSDRPNRLKPGVVTEQPFLVTWDGDADPENPRSMSSLRRWIIVLICAASSLCVQLEPDFGVSQLICTLGLSLYVAGLGTGPMILSPLSEFYGRRPIYICSFTFFLIWLIPCAVARNIQTMLVARFLDGLAGSAFLSVAGGTVGDMFGKHELSAPMMIYTAAPFVGPEVGPLIGGFIIENTSWRWCFYVLIIWTGVQLALIIFFVPETYHPVLLRNKAIRLRKETGNQEWIAPIEKLDRSIAKTVMLSCIRPFELLCLEPMCLNLCILSAILLGILYLFFGAFPLVFQNNHGFSIAQTGLAFLGLLIGMLMGISTDPIWRKIYGRLVRQREAAGGEAGGSEPEYRLPSTILGAWVVPIALFGMLWTRFLNTIADPADQYPLYAASALAANSFARSYFAAAFPLFGVQMYENLGYQWATTLLAFLALAMAPYVYSQRSGSGTR